MDLTFMTHNIKYPIYSDPFANTYMYERGSVESEMTKQISFHWLRKLQPILDICNTTLKENKLRHIEYIGYTTPPNMIPE